MRGKALVLLVFFGGCALVPDHGIDRKKSQDRVDMAKDFLRKSAAQGNAEAANALKAIGRVPLPRQQP